MASENIQFSGALSAKKNGGNPPSQTPSLRFQDEFKKVSLSVIKRNVHCIISRCPQHHKIMCCQKLRFKFACLATSEISINYVFSEIVIQVCMPGCV